MEIRNRESEQNGLNLLINQINGLVQKEGALYDSSYENDINIMLNRIQDDSFRIAIVGEFSSGKSTFLNALMKRDILKHGTKETTATITEIQNDSTIEDDVFDVYFINGEVEKDIPIGKLSDYTSTSSTIHQVAQEIAKVVIRTKIIDTNQKIIFVDTPGLNGIADNHREKTIEMVKNAHACIYLMQVRGLGKSDIEFINFITQYQKNIIFVQNFIDELFELEGETLESKLRQQNSIIQDKILDHVQINYKLVGVSARQALIACDQELQKSIGLSLENKDSDILYGESNFISCINAINQFIEENENNRIQKEETLKVLAGFLEEIKASYENQLVVVNEEWENSRDMQNKRKIDVLIENIKNNKETTIQKIKNFIDSKAYNTQKDVMGYLDSNYDSINEGIRKYIESIDNLKDVEGLFEEDTLNYMMCKQLSCCNEVINKLIQNSFNVILSDVMLRIQDYVGYKVNPEIVQKFETESNTFENPIEAFKQKENYLQSEKAAIQEMDSKLEYEKQQNEKRKKELESLELEKQQIQYNQNLVDNEKDRKIRNLGKMPDQEKKYRYETRSRTKRFLFWSWTDYYDVEVPYMDKTKQNQWKEKKSRIEEEYKKSTVQFEGNRRRVNQRQTQIRDDIKRYENSVESRNRSLEQRKRIHQKQVEEMELAKTLAKTEYMNSLKKSLVQSVQEYLMENELIKSKENYEKAIELNSDDIKNISLQLFEQTYNERLEMLSQISQQGTENKYITQLNSRKTQIEDVKKSVEDYLCQI